MNAKFKLSTFVGGAEGNLRSLSRLAAALRSAHAFSLTPLWRKKRVPDTFFLALRFPSNQNKRTAQGGSFILVEPRGIEPLSENPSAVLSPSAVYLQDSPRSAPTDRRATPVASLVHGRAQSFARHTFTAK